MNMCLTVTVTITLTNYIVFITVNSNRNHLFKAKYLVCNLIDFKIFLETVYIFLWACRSFA